MPKNSSNPYIISNIEPLKLVLKHTKNGKLPSQIQKKLDKKKNNTIDVSHIIENLVCLGLLDHLAVISMKKAKPGVHFLTDKGIKWLQTYDTWERLKYKMSKFQLLGGIILGILINILYEFLSPHIEPFVQ